MRIGFIGLGNMGGPMAANLLRAGRDIIAFDINEQAMSRVLEQGAEAGASVSDVAARADLVITVLPSPRHVRQVYQSVEGVIAAARTGTVLLDCSTVDPQTARDLVSAAAARGLPMADAPISGGALGAAEATLSFLVGADEALFARVEPVLMHMGRLAIRCGGAGSGQVVKICNNLLLAISMAGTSEVMALGVKLGADPGVLAAGINASSGRCFSSERFNPWPGVSPDAPASHGFAPGGTAEIMLKDVTLALEAAHEVRQPAMLGAVTQQLYHMLIDRGHGELDLSAIIGVYREELLDMAPPHAGSAAVRN